MKKRKADILVRAAEECDCDYAKLLNEIGELKADLMIREMEEEISFQEEIVGRVDSRLKKSHQALFNGRKLLINLS